MIVSIFYFIFSFTVPNMYGCSNESNLSRFSFYLLYYISFIHLDLFCRYKNHFLGYIIKAAIHQLDGSFMAQTGVFIREGEEPLNFRETVTWVYVQRMDKPFYGLYPKRDVFMSAIEIHVHGIVDLLAVWMNFVNKIVNFYLFIIL